jgi:hypothetical protein
MENLPPTRHRRLQSQITTPGKRWGWHSDYVPSISAIDFSRESFPAAPTDPALLDQCRVDPARQKEYAALDREAFRERYFDANGNLRDGFSSLNSDTGFIATAFDHGFFVMQGDLTGLVQLDRE